MNDNEQLKEELKQRIEKERQAMEQEAIQQAADIKGVDPAQLSYDEANEIIDNFLWGNLSQEDKDAVFTSVDALMEYAAEELQKPKDELTLNDVVDVGYDKGLFNNDEIESLLPAGGNKDDAARREVILSGHVVQKIAHQKAEAHKKKMQALNSEEVQPLLQKLKDTDRQQVENILQIFKNDTQSNTPEAMRKKLDVIALAVDYMRNPEETLAQYSGGSETQRLMASYDILENRFSAFADVVAKKTGAEPEKIKDPETRTDEQMQLLLEAAAREQISRFTHMHQTNYYKARSILAPIKGKYEDPEPEDDYSIKQYAVLYFFALHYDDTKPHNTDFTAENEKELKEIYQKIDAFYYEKTKDGKINRTPDLFTQFIKTDSKNPDAVFKILPEIMVKPLKKVNLPIDKINHNVWDDLEGLPKNEQGQIYFADWLFPVILQLL